MQKKERFIMEPYQIILLICILLGIYDGNRKMRLAREEPERYGCERFSLMDWLSGK